MIAIMSVADHLRALLAVERSFAVGEFLFHRGDRVRRMHLVLAGAIDLTRHQEDGASLVLQRSVPGSVLAEASLHADRYHCDAIATAPTRTLAITRADFLARLIADPGFAQAWTAHLAQEVHKARLRAEMLALRTVAARFDAWCAANDGMTPAKGAWRVVAAEIGVSPEALYRELARRRRSARSG